MLQQDYDTVLIGASALAMGAALSAPQGEVLIIEPSACMAAEWTETFYPGSDWAALGEAQPRAALAQALLAEMEQRHIKTERGIHTPGISALLFKAARDQSMPISFMTRVLSVSPDKDGFAIQVVNAGGLYTFHAQRIIDTTATFISDPQTQVAIRDAFVGVHLRAQPKLNLQTESHDQKEYAFIRGAFETEASLHLRLGEDRSLPRVRKQVHDFLIQRPEALRHWNCTAVATRLRLAVEAVDSGTAGWTHQPASQYAHVIAAIDAGTCVWQQQAQGALA